MAMGTPEYMAPEQAAGRPPTRAPTVTRSADLYEMLTGRPPYQGDNFMEILTRRPTSCPRPRQVRRTFPPELEALILTGMAKVPGARPQTMEELERDIQQIATRFFPPRTEQDLAIVAGAGGLVAGAVQPHADRARRDLGVVGVGSDHRRRRGPAAASVPQVESQEDRDGGGRASAAAWRGGAGRDLQARQQGRGPPGGHRIATTRAGDSARDCTTRATSGAAADRHDADCSTKPGEEPGAEKTGTDEADDSDDSDSKTVESEPATRHNGAARSGRAAGASAADSRKQLEEAERLLRAERFTEARGIFSRLAKSRRDRGPALVRPGRDLVPGEALRRRGEVGDARGGSRRRRARPRAARRRALSIHRFKEAAKAYEGALKLDPRNASARSGLALANKRM